MSKKLEIFYKNTDEVIPYKDNPRLNDKAVEAVANSIRDFGFKVPIIIDKDNVIIAGHTRVKAAKELGLKEVPTILADDLTPAQIKAFRLADNKVSELAEWNEDLLLKEIRELEDIEIDLSAYGFEDIDISIDDIVDDEFEIDEEAQPTSKLGDMFKLGDHVLLCGDATKEKDIMKLMDGDIADLVVTDPPYNVGYESKGKKQLSMKNDDMDNVAYISFLEKTFKNIDKVLKNGGAFYIWHASATVYEMLTALRQTSLKDYQMLVWVKNHATLTMSDYQWRHEPCLYGWKKGAAHYFTEDRTNTTTFEDRPRLNSMNKEQLKDYIKQLINYIEEGSTVTHVDIPLSNNLHPTMKPIKLIAKQILNSSKPNELILDTFGGSGSTLIAAEQTGRRCKILELDPVYVDAIVKRWEELTGLKAEKINI